MDSYSVDSDEVMKCVVKVLNDSSLQLFRSINCFIASSLRLFSQRLTLHRHYFFFKRIIARHFIRNVSSQLLLKVTLPISALLPVHSTDHLHASTIPAALLVISFIEFA
jgi:hypothetical protein